MVTIRMLLLIFPRISCQFYTYETFFFLLSPVYV